MRVVGGFVEEQILHHHALHRREASRDMVGIGVGLKDILALHKQSLERSVGRCVQHVGNA